MMPRLRRYSKRTIGVDPGTRNLALCQLRFEGFRYDPATMEQIPLVTPLHLELWDIKSGICLRNSAADGGRFERCSTRVEMRVTDDKDTDIDDWIAQMNHFIVRSDWIFEREEDEGELAMLTVENQCDHIKTKGKRWDMFLVSNIFASSVDIMDKHNAAIDALDKAAASGVALVVSNNPLNRPKRPLHHRTFAKSSAKYGIKSDGALVYGGRKSTGVDITRELFRLLGLTRWILFLDSVENSGQKIDDLCDAFLLALQYAIDEYEAWLKSEKKTTKTNGSDIAPPPTKTGGGSSMLTMIKQTLALRETPCGQIDTSALDDAMPRLIATRRLDDRGNSLGDEVFFPENCGASSESSDESDYSDTGAPLVPRPASNRVRKPTRIFGNYAIEADEDNGKKKTKKKKSRKTTPTPKAKSMVVVRKTTKRKAEEAPLIDNTTSKRQKSSIIIHLEDEDEEEEDEVEDDF